MYQHTTMSANNFSLPAPSNGLKIDHRNPPSTHIFSDVPIDGITHSVVYICGGEMVSRPTPLPPQKNYDLFLLSDEEDGLEGLELLPPLPPKKKKGAKADYQARKEARRLKKQAALDTINAVFVGIRTREEAQHAQEIYAAELKKERAARKAQRKSPAEKARQAALKESAQKSLQEQQEREYRLTLETYAKNLKIKTDEKTNAQLETAIQDKLNKPQGNKLTKTEPLQPSSNNWTQLPTKEEKQKAYEAHKLQKQTPKTYKTTRKPHAPKPAKKSTTTSQKPKPVQVEYHHEDIHYPSLNDGRKAVWKHINTSQGLHSLSSPLLVQHTKKSEKTQKN